MYTSTQNVTIASGANITDALNVGNGRLVGIAMPAAWDTAAITFQASADGSTYYDLYDSDGSEVTISSSAAAASRYLAFTSAMLPVFAGLRYLKIRSGTSATPVNQTADRILTLVKRPV